MNYCLASGTDLLYSTSVSGFFFLNFLKINISNEPVIALRYLVDSTWDGTGCEFDAWQCRVYTPCSLSLWSLINPRIVFNKILVFPELNRNIFKMGYMVVFKMQ